MPWELMEKKLKKKYFQIALLSNISVYDFFEYTSYHLSFKFTAKKVEQME